MLYSTSSLAFLAFATSTISAFVPLPYNQNVLPSARKLITPFPPNSALAMAEGSDKGNSEDADTTTTTNTSASTKESDGRYDVSKLVGGLDEDGSGFNQFDPVLSGTQFLSRRFGIFGGLAIFAALAAVEGREIIKGLNDVTPLQGDGETITTASGLKYTDVLVGKAGSAPLPGYIIGLRAVVKIGDQIIYETAAGEKPVAFKYGQRPFQNVICEGVEEGIKGMKVGGKRILDVPANLAPPGVELPPGVPLTYEIELSEVLSGYF